MKEYQSRMKAVRSQASSMVSLRSSHTASSGFQTDFPTVSFCKRVVLFISSSFSVSCLNVCMFMIWYTSLRSTILNIDISIITNLRCSLSKS
jgi:hypothetical protein